MTKINFEPDLNLTIVYNGKNRPEEDFLEKIRSFCKKTDKISVIPGKKLSFDINSDVLIFTQLCGYTPLAKIAADISIPVLTIEKSLGFHPYQAAFRIHAEDAGASLLPSFYPEDIQNSLQAVRALKSLRNKKLIVVDTPDSFRSEMIEEFSSNIREIFGIEIVLLPSQKLKKLASGFSDKDAEKELIRWGKNIIEPVTELSREHMLRVAKLYLAEKKLLEEYDACGITVNDIKDFLLHPKKEIMPNVTYAILVHDGYLACEEADIEALASELILFAATLKHPSMTNIYYAYRDCFNSLDSYRDYTTDMELKDVRQTFKDNILTATHFGAVGVIPPSMMREKKYKIRETLPSWPGQSMAVATPKKGKVVLLRLDNRLPYLHYQEGEIIKVISNDKYGWQRYRYFIKIDNAEQFASECLHHHYAVGLQNHRLKTLEYMLDSIYLERIS